MRTRTWLTGVLAAAVTISPLAMAAATAAPTVRDGSGARDGSTSTAKAPSYRVIHSFTTADSHNANGALVLGQDGDFYGTTSGNYDEIDHGSVFRMDHKGHVTVIHRFAGPDGDQPIGLVQAPSGVFYGVTQSGGTGDCPYGCGTVFAMTPAGDVTVLHSFQSGKLDGSAPNPVLAITPDGRIYGTTKLGPIQEHGENWGIAFRIDPATGQYDVLHAFMAPDGTNPQGGLVLATDGTMYGVTNERGPSGAGTVFRLSPEGAVTVVHGFAFSDGAEPKAALLQAQDGRLYGTAEKGGTGSGGVVFSLELSGAGFTVLHSFRNDGSDGYRPVAGLIQTSKGRIYGTTPLGGQPPDDPNRSGVVYQLSKTGAVKVLHTFTGADGGRPVTPLTDGGKGRLYGTTFVGGATGQGVAFVIR